MELPKRERQITHVAQRIAHAQEVRRRIGGRDALGAARKQLHTRRHVRVAYHARAGINTHDARRIPDDARGFARHQPGARPNIEDPHAGA